jgi:prepilin-type N-terminal cleavage/methylation domain-containing protein
MEAHTQKSSGFTLDEISIVMIIIGLLIGGTFGGMKLIENSKIQKAAQDLKSFDSAGITFKDIYRALPGDIRSPSTRLPNCTSAPCSTAGNGDRRIGGDFDGAAITAADEEFTFWQHLLAADLISGVKPVGDLTYGEGQPDSPLDSGGYRLIGYTSTWDLQTTGKHLLWISDKNSAAFGGFDTIQDSISCQEARFLDSKIDDGLPRSGKMTAQGYCSATNTLNSDWTSGGTTGAVWYRLAF